jgi:hypothetical protein
VPGLVREHVLNIRKRVAVVFLQEKDRGSPVPGLHELRSNFDNGVEQPDRQVIVSCLARLLHARHQQVDRVASGGLPERPNTLLDRFRAGFVRGNLERFKQKLQVPGAIPALHLWYVGGRLDQRPRRCILGLRSTASQPKAEQHHGSDQAAKSWTHGS